jgi:hypothetical protein
MKIKTSELKDQALDWAVARCEGGIYEGPSVRDAFWIWPSADNEMPKYSKKAPPYSTDWAQGGPILTREHISRTIDHSGLWIAYDGYNYSGENEHMQCDKSELVAGLRCYVASKLGDEVEVPDELA